MGEGGGGGCGQLVFGESGVSGKRMGRWRCEGGREERRKGKTSEELK